MDKIILVDERPYTIEHNGIYCLTASFLRVFFKNIHTRNFIMIRIIVAGSRDYHDYELMESIIDAVRMRENKPVAIVSGGARGADKLGEKYAKEHNLELHIYEANWSKYGRGAGFVRNEEMADNADMLLAFWDGKSNGTKHMIRTARKAGLPTELFIQ